MPSEYSVAGDVAASDGGSLNGDLSPLDDSEDEASICDIVS